MPGLTILIAVALTMALGSFVAGFTALGGGAIAFPVLTKLLGYSVADARQFGVFIQSVGMTSASLFLLRRHGLGLLDGPLRLYLVSCFAGAILGFFWLTLSPPVTKAVFSCFILSFAVLNAAKWRLNLGENAALIVLLGLVGGVLSHNIGTGADGVYFILACVLLGAPIKRTIWQSVIIMAATSLLLAGLNLSLAEVSAKVAWSWAVAAPIVVFGAAFGAHLTSRVPERVLDYAFLALAGLEFFWTVRWLLS